MVFKKAKHDILTKTKEIEKKTHFKAFKPNFYLFYLSQKYILKMDFQNLKAFF